MGILRITVAAALIVGAGLVQGAWTNRWGPSPALTALASRLDAVPMVIGDWKATTVELGERERKMAGAEACLSRVYTNSRGTSVSVLLLGGLPGDITTHTPDVCYRGAGYELATPAPYDYRPRGADGSPAGLRTSVATRGGANSSALRIYWAWHTPTGWSAPDGARWKFASEPIVTKLYVVRETGGVSVPADRDPCNDFLEVFLPELERAVFRAAS